MNLLTDYFRDDVPTRPGFILEDAERELITRALIHFDGHRERTAQCLGIGVRTLAMKIKKWNLQAAGRKEVAA